GLRNRIAPPERGRREARLAEAPPLAERLQVEGRDARRRLAPEGLEGLVEHGQLLPTPDEEAARRVVEVGLLAHGDVPQGQDEIRQAAGAHVEAEPAEDAAEEQDFADELALHRAEPSTPAVRERRLSTGGGRRTGVSTDRRVDGPALTDLTPGRSVASVFPRGRPRYTVGNEALRLGCRDP